MTELKTLTDAILKFRDDRDWARFHTPKDMVLSLMLEAAELAEHFQWKSSEEIESYLKKEKSAVADELVDVLYWVLLMAADFDISLSEAFGRKMAENEKKYPLDLVRGKHEKYTSYTESK